MANNYGTLEGELEVYGTLDGEIQFGGASGNGVKDVKVNGTSVVDANKVANIDLTPYAEKEDVYDKDAIDTALQAIDTALEGKADTDDIPTELSDLTDDENHRLVTDTEKNTWDNKADESDIPTVNNPTITIQKNNQNIDSFTLNQDSNKSINITVPTKTSDLQNDNSFITNTVNNLANYYLKSDTYTQTEVNNLISAAVNGRFEKVTVLPASGEPNVIYLVPKTTALTNNVYDEYIWQDNAWELLGSTEIDLSNYVTTTDLATALADYVTSSTFNTTIANYYTKTEVGNLLDAKVDKVSGKGLSTYDYDATAKGIVDNVTTNLASKVDKVNGKGLSTEDYTTTEKNKLAGISTGANKVESSTTNGNIQIDGTETQVYDDSDIQDKIDVSLESVSGNPLSISGLKSSQLAVNPVITYNPIQDLHGQSKPYPAGGGKNLIPMTIDGIKAANTSGGSWSGNVWTSTNGVTFTILTDDANNVIGIKVNGTASANTIFHLMPSNVSLTSGNYTISGCPAGGSATTYALRLYYNDTSTYVDDNGGNGVTVSTSLITGSRIIIRSGYVATNLMFYPQVESGSTKTAFAPYSNICPISGYDKIEVLSCGVNIWDEEWEVGSINNADGQNNNSDTSNIRSKNYNVIAPNTSYYQSAASGKYVWIHYYDANKIWISGEALTTGGGVFTTPNNSNIKYFRIRTTSNYGSTYQNNIGINYPATQTSYVASHKTTDLSESLGQTVYGGTYDPRTGIFTATHGIKDMGDLTWYSAANNVFYSENDIGAAKKDGITSVCSCYEAIANVSGTSSMTSDKVIALMNSTTNLNRVYVRDTAYSNASTFKTDVTGQKLVYELATPFTIQLTPHEIALSQDYAYISTNGTLIALDYHNGEMAALSDVTQLSETVERLTEYIKGLINNA